MQVNILILFYRYILACFILKSFHNPSGSVSRAMLSFSLHRHRLISPKIRSVGVSILNFYSIVQS